MTKYVNIKWSNYHSLSMFGEADIFDTYEEAERTLESSQDYVLVVFADNEAREVADAFNQLCVACWTPNQSLWEREKNGPIIEECLQKINRYS